jgi:PIN domain nuclease of toxin-antitoxin system
VTTPERLTQRVIDVLYAPNRIAYISVISYWEVMIKSMKGMLGEIGDPPIW